MDVEADPLQEGETELSRCLCLETEPCRFPCLPIPRLTTHFTYDPTIAGYEHFWGASAAAAKSTEYPPGPTIATYPGPTIAKTIG